VIPVAAAEPNAPAPPKRLGVEKIALPPEPAPPKAAAKFPATIPLPN
jgi:hypothetical protein